MDPSMCWCGSRPCWRRALPLWWGTVLLVRSGVTGYPTARLRSAVAVTDIGLAAFVALWLGFILTGLWFSYWVKMGPVQQAHMTLLIISICAVIASTSACEHRPAEIRSIRSS